MKRPLFWSWYLSPTINTYFPYINLLLAHSLLELNYCVSTERV